MSPGQFLFLVIAALLIAWFARDGLVQLKGSQSPGARALFLGVEGLAVAVSLIGLVVQSWMLLGFGLAIGWAAAAMTPRIAPRARRKGSFRGLSDAWIELHAFEGRKHAEPLSAEDRMWLDRHLAGLERWRTPDTSVVIDLWRQTAVGQYADPPMDPTTLDDLNDQLAAEVRRLWSARLSPA
jgi:hypothetical protein